MIHPQSCASFLTTWVSPHVHVLVFSFLNGSVCRIFKRWERAHGLVRPDQGWALLCRHCIDCSVSHTLGCLVQEEGNATSLLYSLQYLRRFIWASSCSFVFCEAASCPSWILVLKIKSTFPQLLFAWYCINFVSTFIDMYLNYCAFCMHVILWNRCKHSLWGQSSCHLMHRLCMSVVSNVFLLAEIWKVLHG